MTKHYILDTNVLAHDPLAIHCFGGHEVVIPLIVLEELDGLKDNPRIGHDVREATKQLENLRVSGDISKGVKTRGGGTLRIELNGADYKQVPKWFERKPDNLILAVTRGIQRRQRTQEPVILVTNDINLRLKANSLGIRAEPYLHDRVDQGVLQYQGIVSIRVEEGEIHHLHSEGFLVVNEESPFFGLLQPNICCEMFSGDGKNPQTAFGIYKSEKAKIVLCEKARARHDRKGSVMPRNDRQALAYDLCMDPGLSLVTLSGPAGTGKTLMACLAGIRTLMDESSSCKRLLVLRPIEEVGKELGFLPGTIEEKFDPWVAPIYACVDLIVGGGKESTNGGGGVNTRAQKVREAISVKPINYIRGVTISNTFVIIDEAQNLTPHALKTAVTRIGEGSRLIITGDSSQIDNKYLDSWNNGLVHVVSRFAGQEVSAHLRLTQSERSLLAELGAKLL